MIETIILLKPQNEWRSGMTKNDIINELNAKLQIPWYYQWMDNAHHQSDQYAFNRYQNRCWHKGVRTKFR
jgi:Cu/Ag efflux pump CusA